MTAGGTVYNRCSFDNILRSLLMARVTVEDCLDEDKNRFRLVLAASQRAREIMLGAEPLVQEDNDKATVLALREIASGKLTVDGILEKEEPLFVHPE